MPRLAVASPVGLLTLIATDDALTALDWGRAEDEDPTPLLRDAADQLAAYFDRRLTRFDLPMSPAGSDFQQRVWQVMRAIPYGETRAYGEVARDLRSSPRAVGGACGRNPLPILSPCHRILAADARLGGYSGGQGGATKRFLLALEGARFGV